MIKWLTHAVTDKWLNISMNYERSWNHFGIFTADVFFTEHSFIHFFVKLIRTTVYTGIFQ